MVEAEAAPLKATVAPLPLIVPEIEDVCGATVVTGTVALAPLTVAF